MIVHCISAEKLSARYAKELTVIVVSYNTASMTLKALEALDLHNRSTRFDCFVIDNASTDGSVEQISAAFPMVRVISLRKNVGFARANNIAASYCTTPYFLLLNPDTEADAGAVNALMTFAKTTPSAGIWGGRTVFSDRTLNKASCWAAPSPRSLLYRAVGFSRIFAQSNMFNPEAYGGWKRDDVRQVDIVVGCFLLIRRDIWNGLGGFNEKYFMYGEDADLCLRARTLGCHPIITPNAQIIHHVGASTKHNEEKAILVMKARVSLIQDHWPAWQVRYGIFLMWLWSALRFVITRPLAYSRNSKNALRAQRWQLIWFNRRIWLNGYDQA